MGRLHEHFETTAPCRQLLLTASPILCHAIKRSYEKLCTSSEPGYANTDAASICVNAVDFASSSSTEIIAISECSDAMFPLITTYATFIRMLDKCVLPSFFDRGCFFGLPSHEIEAREVTFDRFRHHYCPRFDESLQDEVSLVYSEIVTNIKGSIKALKSAGGCMDQSEYVKLCEKRDNFLTALRRKDIYRAFQKYEKLKGERGEYDHLDVVHHVYQRLQGGNFSEYRKCTSVFIDEVQGKYNLQLVV